MCGGPSLVGDHDFAAGVVQGAVELVRPHVGEGAQAHADAVAAARRVLRREGRDVPAGVHVVRRVQAVQLLRDQIVYAGQGFDPRCVGEHDIDTLPGFVLPDYDATLSHHGRAGREITLR